MGNPFWDFSLKLYAAPGVEAACLELQETAGADVNLLLFCCWAGARGHALGEAELDRLLAAAADWHTEVVRPLRAARRWLKPVAAGDPPAGALRERIKALELEAERLEQDRLHAALPLPVGAFSEAAVSGNLARYVARLGGGGSVEAGVLARAAAVVHGKEQAG